MEQGKPSAVSSTSARAHGGHESNVAGVHLYVVLWKAYRALRAHADGSIKKLGLIESDFAVLESILHKGSLRVNTIGRKVGLASASITAAVDRLEGRGLVRREDDAADRRTRLVALTAEGRTLITSAFAAHQEAMEKAADALSIEERGRLLTLLRKWGKSVETPGSTDDEER